MESQQKPSREKQLYWRIRQPRNKTRDRLIVIFLIIAAAVIFWIFRQIEPRRADPFSQEVPPVSFE